MHIKTLRSCFTPVNVVGAILFCAAAMLYLTTMPPGVTLWDCGEFALCGRWLEVGHPPGAPLYVLLLRAATMFAPSDDRACLMCNAVSAIAAAAAIWLFYRIALMLIALALHCVDCRATAAAAVAAATFAVTDTLWTSATETEVYAPSLLLMVATLYVSLRWLSLKLTGAMAARHIALAALLLGMSASVHLIGLLLIPCIAIIIAIGCDWHGWLRIAGAFAIGCIVLLIVYYCLILNVLAPAKTLELLLVNVVGLPLHSGVVVYAVLLFGALFVMLFVTRGRHATVHSTVLSALLFMIGYSPVAMTLIRACASPSLCLDAPDNVFALDNYINREQYGSRPLFTGEWYNAQPTGVNRSVSVRSNDARDAYETYETVDSYTYDAADRVVFPRMYSHEPMHAYGYAIWGEVDPEARQPPSFAKQLRYCLAYQLNFMFVRYVMWNFVGRQNDMAGYGSVIHGNWISGIPIVDRYLGRRDTLHPTEADSAARTTYFGLPLLLALIGLCTALRRRVDRRVSTLPVWLLLIAGPCVALYLNQPPFEPRERDYIYLGAYMAVALFIAFGAYAVIDLVGRRASSRLSFALIVIVLCLALPTLVLVQNLRGHDRRGDTLAGDMARSYLSQCEADALLVTAGDNDTYPLWAVQEAEGYRRDVRVVNYGTLAAEWNIAQVRHPMRGNDGLPMTIPQSLYRDGRLDYAIVNMNSDDTIPLCYAISRLVVDATTPLRYIASRHLRAATSGGDTLYITLPAEIVERNALALLDIIATDSLRRPIYETAASTAFEELGLSACALDLGAVRMLTADTVHSDLLCVNKFLLQTHLPTASTYSMRDDEATQLLLMQHRLTANRAAQAAIDSNMIQTAVDILTKSLREQPTGINTNDTESVRTAELLYRCNRQQTGRLIFRQLTEYYLRCIAYAVASAQREPQHAQSILDDLAPFGQTLVDALGRTDNNDLSRSIAVHCQSWGIE